MNKTNKANQSSILNRGILRGIGCFVIAGIMAVSGLFATGAFGFGTIEVYATGEPTITTEILRGGGATRTRTRTEFYNYVGGSHVYFNGNLYTANGFFDAHHTSVFRIGSFTFTESRERFGLDEMVRRATLVSTAPVATPTPVVPVVTPAPTTPQTPNIPSVPATPQPTTSPATPVVTPTPSIPNAPAVTAPTTPDSENGNRQSSEPNWYSSSAITLPNRVLTDDEMQTWIDEYWEFGGMSGFELEIVKYTNLERIRHGLNPLEICFDLSMASRFYVQTLVNLDLALSHTAGPYGGSRGTAEAFGVYDRRGANGSGRDITPEGIVNAWMNSPEHRDNILREGISYIGVGSLHVLASTEGSSRRYVRVASYQMFR